jgi:hypothetical protein
VKSNAIQIQAQTPSQPRLKQCGQRPASARYAEPGVPVVKPTRTALAEIAAGERRAAEPVGVALDAA